MVTLTRIDIVSALKVGIVLNALIAAVVSGLYSAFSISVVSLFSGAVSSGGSGDEAAAFAAVSYVTICALCIGSVVAGGIFGGIYFSVLAVAYNLTASWVGGFQVELDYETADLFDFDE